MKLFYLYILLFLVANTFKAQELEVYNIGFLDVAKDERYLTWGIHPVDIRSKLNKEKRPLEGAKLGIEDSKKFIRLTKTNFFLEHIRKETYSDAVSFLNSDETKKFNTIILDLNIKNIKDLKKILISKPNIIFFNVSDPNNNIRKKLCLNNFFNTYPSNSMFTDSIAQYLVKKKT